MLECTEMILKLVRCDVLTAAMIMLMILRVSTFCRPVGTRRGVMEAVKLTNLASIISAFVRKLKLRCLFLSFLLLTTLTF
jgi:hypothetical protein